MPIDDGTAVDTLTDYDRRFGAAPALRHPFAFRKVRGPKSPKTLVRIGDLTVEQEQGSQAGLGCTVSVNPRHGRSNMGGSVK